MRFRDRIRAAARLAALLAMVAWPVSRLEAGEAPVEPEPEPKEAALPETDIYLDDSEDVERLLRQAARLGEAGEWKICLERFQECLQKYGGCVARSPEDSSLYMSVEEVVRAEMAAVPPEGRAFWRNLRLGEFEGKLRAARARGGDAKELAELARDFAGLEFAAQAQIDLGEALYARGDVPGAVRVWHDLLRRSPGGDYPRSALIFRAALAAAGAGMKADAASLLRLLRREAGLLQIGVGGARVSAVETLEARLQVEGKVPGPGTAPSVWSAMGGDAAHSLPAPPLPAITAKRWSRALPVPEQWTGGAAAANMARLRSMGLLAAGGDEGWPYPPYHAAAAGELVIVSGDLGVMAFRAHDGVPAWFGPGETRGVASSGGACVPVLAGENLLARQGQTAVARYYGEPVSVSALVHVEALSGEAAGGTDRIPAPPEANRFRPDEEEDGGGGGDGGVEGGDDNVGGKPADSTQGPQGTPTLFVGAPVVDGGTVVCALMRAGGLPEIELVGFEAERGRLVWRRFVCGGRPLQAAANNWMGVGGPAMTDPGLPMAAGGGVVYTVTNLGAIAAADATTGGLRWLRIYPRVEPGESRVPGRGIGAFQFQNVPKPFDRAGGDVWEACAPVLAEGLLLAAPQDCDFLLAIEAATGQLAWRAPRCGLRRLLGVAEGKVLLSGNSEIVARDLRNGRALWRSRLKAEVVGHGAVGRDYVAVSTRKALEVLDLSGKPLRSFAWKDGRDEAGNVMVHGENVYTVSATHVNAYCDMEAVSARLAKGAAEPGDALARFLAGTLDLAAGRRREAVERLKKALAAAGPDEVWNGRNLAGMVRDELWRCGMDEARECAERGDDAGALAALDSALGHARGEERLAPALLERAVLLEKAGRAAEAVECYQRLLTECPDAPCVRADGTRLRARLLAAAEIPRLVASGGADLYAAHEARAAELLAEAKRSGSIEAAEQIAREYPASRSAGEALRLAAELAARANRPDLELRALRQRLMLESRSKSETADACARLALAYARHGCFGAASVMAGRLAAIGERVSEGDRELTPEEFVAAHPELSPRGAPESTPPLSERWSLELASGRLVDGSAGDSSLVLSGAGRVLAVDASGGRTLWTWEPEPDADAGNAQAAAMAAWRLAQPIPAMVDGDTVMLWRHPGKLIALERTTGRLRWSREQKQQFQFGQPNVPQYGGMQVARTAPEGADGLIVFWDDAGVLDQLGRGKVERVLRALSPDDGRELWSLGAGEADPTVRSFAGNSGTDRGIARTADGSVLAWTTVREAPDPKRAARGAQQFRVMFILAEPQSGRVAGRFEIRNCSVLAVPGDRILCKDPLDGKIKAFGLDGKKLWESSGNWDFRALSDDGSLLVGVMMGTRNPRTGASSATVAALDTRTGSVVWRDSSAGVRNFSFARLDGDVVLGVQQMPYTGIGAYGARAELVAFDARTGKELWRSPFAGTVIPARGSKHAVAALAAVQMFDEKDQPIVPRQRRGPVVIAVAQPQQPPQPAAVEHRITLRLFDLASGKAVWESVRTKKKSIEAGQAQQAQQMIWMWANPYYSGGQGSVSALPEGFLVSSREEVFMMGAGKK